MANYRWGHEKLLLALTLATGAALVSCGGGGGGGGDFVPPEDNVPYPGEGNPPSGGNPPSSNLPTPPPTTITPGKGSYLNINSITTDKSVIKLTNDSFTVTWNASTDASGYVAWLSLYPESHTLDMLNCPVGQCQVTCKTFFSNAFGYSVPRLQCDNGIEAIISEGQYYLQLDACIATPSLDVICKTAYVEITIVK